MNEPIATKERLARVLSAEGLPIMAAQARAGLYDDFESEEAFPQHLLVAQLRLQGRHDLAQRAIDGEWDSTDEESDAWAARQIAEGGPAAALILVLKRARNDR